MSATRRRIGRVAPGTAYVAGNDLITITPQYNGLIEIELATSVAVQIFKRINGVNILMNDGVPLGVDSGLTLSTMSDPRDAVTIRLGANCNIDYLYVDEINGDI